MFYFAGYFLISRSINLTFCWYFTSCSFILPVSYLIQLSLFPPIHLTLCESPFLLHIFCLSWKTVCNLCCHIVILTLISTFVVTLLFSHLSQPLLSHCYSHTYLNLCCHIVILTLISTFVVTLLFSHLSQPLLSHCYYHTYLNLCCHIVILTLISTF